MKSPFKVDINCTESNKFTKWAKEYKFIVDGLGTRWYYIKAVVNDTLTTYR
jgi:hypothetical protein